MTSIKIILGLLFGATVLWLLFAAHGLDAAALFLLGGVVPGTKVMLSADSMMLVYGGALAVVIFGLLAWRVPYREVAAKAEEAEKVVAIRRHETARLEAAKDSARRRSRVNLSLRLSRPLETLERRLVRAYAVCATAVGQYARRLKHGTGNINRRVRRVSGRCWRRFSDWAVRQYQALAARMVTYWHSFAAYLRPRLARLGRMLWRETQYALHGTQVSLRGAYLSFRDTSLRIAGHSSGKRFLDLMRARFHADAKQTKGQRSDVSDVS